MTTKITVKRKNEDHPADLTDLVPSQAFSFPLLWHSFLLHSWVIIWFFANTSRVLVDTCTK